MGRLRASKAAFRLFQIAVISLVVLAVATFAGRGPFASKDSSSSVSDTSSTSNRKPPTSSSIPELELRSYKKGQCVTWDQTAVVPRQDTRVVPCTQPHLVEIAGSIQASGESDHYPTETQWKQVFANECLPLVQHLVGAALDPVGRFTTGGIRPLADAWSVGNRAVWCGAISALGEHRPDLRLAAFTGKVEGASQTFLDPVGSCASATALVSCAKPHFIEITGYADVPKSTVEMPAGNDDAGWRRLVGDQCAQRARAYVARDLRNGEVGAWIPILGLSWDVGRRTVECTIARFDARGTPVSAVGSLKG